MSGPPPSVEVFRFPDICLANGLDRDRMNEFIAKGAISFLPDTVPGKVRLLSSNECAGMRAFARVRSMGWNVKAANDWALIVMQKMPAPII